MDEKLKIQVEILAASDAGFVPNRRWKKHLAANLYFAQKNFHKHGVFWASDGNEAQRKAEQRMLGDMDAAGLVETFRPHRVKLLGVRLSPAADAATRVAIGLPGVYAGWLSALELEKRSMPPNVATTLTEKWVSEKALFDAGKDTAADYPDQAYWVAEMMMPAMVRGMVESNSNILGEVFYSLTAAGWKWIDEDSPNSDMPATWDKAGQALYYNRRLSTYARFETAEPERRGELGECPLPVSMRGCELRPVNPFKK